MHHTDADNEAAAKKARGTPQRQGTRRQPALLRPVSGTVEGRVSKALRALNDPMIGDGLDEARAGRRTFWMQALVAKGDKLDNNNLKQQPAMPLSSFLRFDPWTDKLIPMHSAFEPILSAADKMPFEVEPVYLKLSYYKPPVVPADAPAPPSAAAPAGTAGASAPVPAAPADATQPAAAAVTPPTQ